jgi:hypothetical protein
MWIARLAGVLGVVSTAVSIGARLGGAYWLGAFQTGTVLQAGMAAMLVACLAYMVILAEWPGERGHGS